MWHPAHLPRALLVALALSSSTSWAAEAGEARAGGLDPTAASSDAPRALAIASSASSSSTSTSAELPAPSGLAESALPARDLAASQVGGEGSVAADEDARREDAPSSATTAEKLQKLQARIDALEEDLDALVGSQDRAIAELNRDRLHWFGDYRLIVNNFHVYDREQGSGSSELFTDLWTHRLRLGMSWEIMDKVRFYGRLVFMKNFGELIEKPIFFDSQTTRFPRDTSLRIERAYIDWFITDWFVFTAGRVAAPEGPPAELKENTERSATWGVQMVEAEFEVVMLTTYLTALLPDTYLRLFYMPFSSVTNIDPFDDDSLFRDIGISPMHAFGSLLELKIPAIGPNLVQVGVVYNPEFKTRFLPLFDTLPKAPFPNTLGWFVSASALIEMKDIARSGLDLFAAYNFIYLAPSGDVVLYDFGDGFEVPLGLASLDDPNDEHTGHMLYGGARYTVPFLQDYAPKLGFETNYGTKYAVMFTSPSDQKINKLATRGLVFEAYYIQPLVKDHLFLRFGGLHVIRQFEGSFVGPATPTNESITNLYVLLHAGW